MREIKFKIWGVKQSKWVDLEDSNSKTEYSLNPQGYIVTHYNDGSGGYDNDSHDIDEFIPVFYTGLKDKNGVECWQCDLRMYNGKIYELVNDGWRWRLNRDLVRFGDNDEIVVDEDVLYESELVGNIYENPELLNQKK